MKASGHLLGYIVGGVAATLLLLFNGFTLYHTSDSIMPTLVSMLHWTPFFWRQNYYGMVWPWFTQLIQNPLLNLAVNTGLCLASGMAAYAMLGWFLFRTWGAVAAGMVAVAALLLLASAPAAWEMLSPSLFFCAPLVWGLTALMLCEEPRPGAQYGCSVRLGVACVLMAAASWYNVSAPLLVGCVAITRDEFWASLDQVSWGWRKFFASCAVRQMLLLNLGAYVGMRWMGRSLEPGPRFAFVAPRLWWEALTSTALHWYAAIQMRLVGFTAACLLCCLVSWALSRTYRKSLQPHLPLLARVLLSACLYAGVVCLQEWARANDYAARYWYPPWLIIQTVSIAAVLVPWYRVAPERWQAAISLGAAAALPLAALLAFGTPTANALRSHIEQLAKGAGEDALRGDASFVAGNYWNVWPAVLHANMLRYEKGDLRPVWGLADKAEPLLATLPPMSRELMRVAVIKSDASEAQAWLQRLALPGTLAPAYVGPSAVAMAIE